MIEWQLFPQNIPMTEKLTQTAECFIQVQDIISSENNTLSSDEVLAVVRKPLMEIDYLIEQSKKKIDKIEVPVLFGRNGKPSKTFNVDGYHESEKIILEVEAGRGVVNNQFLKDLFEACMMHDVDYLVIALRKKYLNGNNFEYVIRFMETLYASNRIQLPLTGILIIGY